jgi:hypothetical protein
MAGSRSRSARRSTSASYRVEAAAALLLAALTAARPADAQTRELHGRVVAANSAPVDGLTLHFANLGEAVTTRAGDFTLEIPAGVTSVPVTLVGSPWKVLSPPDGLLLVPSGPEQVTLWIGEPVDRIVVNALAQYKAQLRESMQRGTAGSEEILKRIDEIAARLGVQREQLDREAELRGRQAEDYPPMAAVVNGYVLEARDLRNALMALQSLIEKNPREALAALKLAVSEYNQAYEKLKTQADGFGAQIEHDWPDGKVARRDFDDFFQGSVEQVHQSQILPLNALLVSIQSALFSGKKDAALKQSLLDLSRSVSALAPSVATMSERAGRTLERLRPGGR